MSTVIDTAMVFSEGFFLLEKSEGSITVRAPGFFEDTIQEQVEVFDRFGRIRRPDQELRELLDQRRGNSQFLLFLLGFEFMAVASANPKPVMNLRANLRDVRLVNVEPAHGQRIREGKQKCGRVDGPDVHDGVHGRQAVVEANVDWVEQAGKLRSRPSQSLCEAAINAAARVGDPLLVE